MNKIPLPIGLSDPTVVNQLSDQLNQARIIASGKTTVSDSELIKPFTTVSSTSSSVTATTNSTLNSASDVTTVYTNAQNIYVSSIDQTITNVVSSGGGGAGYSGYSGFSGFSGLSVSPHNFIASGTIPNGTVVGLKSDGTVSVVGINSGHEVGSKATFNAHNTTILNATLESSSHSIVIAYQDTDSNTGSVIAGTINPLTSVITFGTPTVFFSGTSTYIAITHDWTLHNIIITWADDLHNGHAVVGTIDAVTRGIVLGTPISLGTTLYNSITFSPDTSQLIIGYYNGTNGEALVGAVSGTGVDATIIFGSPVTFHNGLTTLSWSMGYDIFNYKLVIVYGDAAVNTLGSFWVVVGEVGVGTVTFGSPVLLSEQRNGRASLAYNTLTASFLVLYNTGTGSNYGQTKIGQTYGTGASSSIILGAANTVVEASVDWMYGRYNPIDHQMLITYLDLTTGYGMAVTATMSGSVVNFSAPTVYNNTSTYLMIPLFDGISNKMAIIYSAGFGYAMVWALDSNSSDPNVWVGISASAASSNEVIPVTVLGGISNNQVGLTTGADYYVNSNGTLSTSPTTYGLIGRALSATELLISEPGLVSGSSGYSGYSGIGTSGYSGISGYSGNGVSGYSGYSGISGYSGSGVSGYSGYSGISGYSGAGGVITYATTSDVQTGTSTTTTVNPSAMQNGKIVNGTLVTASGTAINFTGIPTWAKRVTVQFNNLSTSGTSLIQIRLGSTSGGVEATGYNGSGGYWGATAAYSSLSTGFTDNTSAASNIRTGTYVFTLTNLSTNTWTCSAIGALEDVAYMWGCGGRKSLTSTLDRVRITTVNGTDTFDGGTVNIMWE